MRAGAASRPAGPAAAYERAGAPAVGAPALFFVSGSAYSPCHAGFAAYVARK